MCVHAFVGKKRGCPACVLDNQTPGVGESHTRVRWLRHPSTLFQSQLHRHECRYALDLIHAAFVNFLTSYLQAAGAKSTSEEGGQIQSNNQYKRYGSDSYTS